MKLQPNKILRTNLVYILFLFFSVKNAAQNNVHISAKIDTNLQQITINQIVTYKNNTKKKINSLLFNDWNYAYSYKESALGKRLSDEYVRNFHLSNEKSRSNTIINEVKSNDKTLIWNRLENQLDLIKVVFEKPLLPNDSITLYLNYILKLPDAKFTRIGYNKESVFIKDSFLSVAKIEENGNFIQYSNENLDDSFIQNIDNLHFEFTIPENFSITSNLNSVSSIGNQFVFEDKNASEIVFSIEKKNSFETYKLSNLDVETNLKDYKISISQKADIIQKIASYFDTKIGNPKQKKLLISQTEYDRNPFYGLNQLPSFLSPFPNEFLFEITFLKAYSQTFLKQNLQIDFRKDHFVFDAIQTYLITQYINENYPDLHLIGNLSKYKIGKGYELSRANFNKQYELYYYLMARKNLDQNVTEGKEKLVKFNEQIAIKNKAGILLTYLDNYLQKSIIENSIKDFYNNQKEINTNEDFISTIEKKAGQNLDWFKNLLNTKTTPDFSFGSFKNEKKSVEIQNNTNTEIPFSITGFENKKPVFKHWYQSKNDTIISFAEKFDKLALNYDKSFPELNNRNNFKSKSLFNRPLRFIFLRDVENPYYNQVFYVPEIGFNVYDGAILSMNFHNKSLIQKPFVFDLSPSYSTKTQNITGSGVFAYTQPISNRDLFQIRYAIAASYYHYIQDAAYQKINPTIGLLFRNNNDLRDNFRQGISARQVIVNKEFSPLSKSKDPLKYSVFDLRYSIGDGETAKSYGGNFNYQLGNNFSKIVAEVGYRKLFVNNFQLSGRLYFGTFLYNNSNTTFYDFGLDRPKDYLFDYAYYGRSESNGLFSQQLIIAEGGFKSKFVNPYANQWLLSSNFSTLLWKYVLLYSDAGLYKNKGFSPKFVYDTGVQVSLVPDYFELYFPMYSSNGFEPSQKNYQEKIRFMVTLNINTLFRLFTRKWF